jgi:hypothetical protein
VFLLWYLCFHQNINTNTDQELKCSMQLQSFLNFLDRPDGIFLKKIEKISITHLFFILDRKCIRQIFIYGNFNIVSFKQVLISITTFVSLKIHTECCTYILSWLRCRPAEDLHIIAVLSHYIPTYIPVSDEYTITGPWLIHYVEVYNDDTQLGV